MTDQLKCPCGKRHRQPRGPRGATSFISEHLNEQVRLYAGEFGAQLQIPATMMPTGYEPMRIQVPPEMMERLRGQWQITRPPIGARPIWDPVQHLARRQEARLAADRALARGRQRG